MEKLKRGLITGLQAIGVFFLAVFISAIYPQNTVVSWICLIATIAIVYVFVAKSKQLAMGLLLLYLFIGFLVFWLTGGLASMIHSITVAASKTIPKLLEALLKIIIGGVFIFFLYNLLFSDFDSGKRDDSFEKKRSVFRKKKSWETGSTEYGGYESSYNHHDTGLKNGSEDYWKIKKHAERIYDNRVEAESSSEREIWIRNGNKFADRLREKYGVDDPEIEYLIEKYYLDHKS